MQFQIPVVLLSMLLAVQAAPADNLEPRFKVDGKVTFSLADGSASVGGNVNGCADVIKSGQSTQLACVIAQSGKGFTMRVTDLKTKKKTECTSTSSSGECGSGATKVKASIA